MPVVFHNGFKYDGHFIIKELAEESEGQFECLGENTEKYITFLVPFKKVENSEIIKYKTKFVGSFRFMSNSLSSRVDNLSEVLHNDKCTDCKFYLEYISNKDELLIFNCLKCSKNHKKHFNNYLIKRFANTYKFYNGDINKFCLMLRKGAYPYEYMDTWKRFDETSLPDKENFYSNLKMEGITNGD